ncbi:MAG: DNA polymerase III subunit alpha [Paraprevotella sp.]|nr:DNA polymerase III subunit alpha [Paraprevotella sp.]
MQDFVHLHVHTQYSILDGQASIPRLVDKAIKDGMRGMAVTDHGNMMGIKEFFNYTNKKNGPTQGEIKKWKKQIALLESGKDAAKVAWEAEQKQKADTARAIREQAIANNEPIPPEGMEPIPEEMPVFPPMEEQLQNARTELAKAKASLFKPIFGCEMYVAHRRLYNMEKEQGDNRRYHLIILAKNETGYHNLVKLVSKSWTDGFYGRPRTDRVELEAHSEGLIVCSACIAGEVPHKVLAGDLAGAEEAALWYKRVFGEDYYLELQRHEVKDPSQRANRETFPLQQRANAALIELARKHDIKLVCTNDCHFVEQENAEAHDRLICLSTNRDLDDPKRMLYSKQEWFKTRQEMNDIFSDIPEALANTCEILDKVEIYSIDHAPIMPNFDIPEEFGTEVTYREKFTEEDLFEEFTRNENGEVVLSREEAESKVQKLGGVQKLYRLKLEADYLAALTYEGARRIYGDPLEPHVKERLNFELHIMKTMGFPGYFLIVQDYINAARHELNVSVGPGRGSAAGSAVAYCLGITKIDPIQYDLLFERFLNPDRISLPDIDVDFDDDGRGKVLSWVTQKYGAEKVAHIITYGTMATKLAIKDVARVQKLPLDTSNRLCKLIPDKLPEDENGKARKMNLPNAISCIPELQEAEASPDPTLRDTLRYARMLEGNVRNTGVHACGVIICRDDVSDWVPISTAEDKETGEKLRCTQYEGSVIEDTGLIKMDFLGLKTLSIIKECQTNIRDSLGIEIDVDLLDIEDPATYNLYCDGRTIGTFQFESAGMQKYLRELQPSTFEDLIAMNALYRPGPMDYIPDFIDRKQGRKPVEYDIPCMEKYLKDTYGITVYQEQVMLLSRQLANFTRGESDTLRKAMGKKLIDKLNHMYPKFIAGGKINGHDPKVLEKIWSDWKKFASYAFNKSHATCYSWVAYQTAFLKANYPAQYMAAVMSRSLANISDITKLMSECKSIGIDTLGPDVNVSLHKFSVDAQGNIRFGLGAIKGMGDAAVDAIIKERKTNGPFKSIFDFVQRVPASACKRNNLESLVLSGAFDSFGTISREQFFATNSKGEVFLDALSRYGARYQTDQDAAQNSLFGGFDVVEIATPEVPQATPWSSLERLNKERDLVGIYLSAHPLDDYSIILQNVCNAQMADLQDLSQFANMDLTLGGMVTNVRKGISKSGKPYGIVTLEDFSGSFEIPLFGQDWPTWGSYMDVGNTIYITAKCQPRQWDPSRLEFRIGKIEFLADIKDKIIESITITMALEALDSDTVLSLSTLIKNNPGTASLYFQISDAEQQNHLSLQSKSAKVSVKKDLISYIENHPSLSYKIN